MNKYHISDDGEVFRVNQDGSFSSMGNVEEQSIRCNATKYNLQELENNIINGNHSRLSIDEVKFVAENSQNSDAVLKASEYDESIIIPILVKRFEDGATFLEEAVLCGLRTTLEAVGSQLQTQIQRRQYPDHTWER